HPLPRCHSNSSPQALRLPAARPFFTYSGLHTDFTSAQPRNTTVQVWTVGEGFGIGSEFRHTCCAANNFRDHEVLFSLVQVLQSRMEPESSSRGALKKRPHFG